GRRDRWLGVLPRHPRRASHVPAYETVRRAIVRSDHFAALHSLVPRLRSPCAVAVPGIRPLDPVCRRVSYEVGRRYHALWARGAVPVLGPGALGIRLGAPVRCAPTPRSFESHPAGVRSPEDRQADRGGTKTRLLGAGVLLPHVQRGTPALLDRGTSLANSLCAT